MKGLIVNSDGSTSLMGCKYEVRRCIHEHAGGVCRCLGASEERNGSVSSSGVQGVGRLSMQGVCRPVCNMCAGRRPPGTGLRTNWCVRGIWECEKVGSGNHIQAKCVRWTGVCQGPMSVLLRQMSV